MTRQRRFNRIKAVYDYLKDNIPAEVLLKLPVLNMSKELVDLVNEPSR